jgi:hypothetical protein
VIRLMPCSCRINRARMQAVIFALYVYCLSFKRVPFVFFVPGGLFHFFFSVTERNVVVVDNYASCSGRSELDYLLMYWSLCFDYTVHTK